MYNLFYIRAFSRQKIEGAPFGFGGAVVLDCWMWVTPGAERQQLSTKKKRGGREGCDLGLWVLSGIHSGAFPFYSLE
jgi:hypothetical protein